MRIVQDLRKTKDEINIITHIMLTARILARTLMPLLKSRI